MPDIQQHHLQLTQIAFVIGEQDYVDVKWCVKHFNYGCRKCGVRFDFDRRSLRSSVRGFQLPRQNAVVGWGFHLLWIRLDVGEKSIRRLNLKISVVGMS